MLVGKSPLDTRLDTSAEKSHIQNEGRTHRMQRLDHLLRMRRLGRVLV